MVLDLTSYAILERSKAVLNPILIRSFNCWKSVHRRKDLWRLVFRPLKISAFSIYNYFCIPV